MTNKTYDLPAIVAQVRSAGNPQMAAMGAVAYNEYLVDSELLEALGVASFGYLPTTPYPDAPMRTRPDNGGQAAASGTLRAALGWALGGLEEFASVWGSVLSDPHGPFSAAQVEALAQIDEAASIWLSGWDAATLMLTGGNDRDN